MVPTGGAVAGFRVTGTRLGPAGFIGTNPSLPEFNSKKPPRFAPRSGQAGKSLPEPPIIAAARGANNLSGMFRPDFTPPKMKPDKELRPAAGGAGRGFPEEVFPQPVQS